MKIGDRLGNYEILAAIGAGGMGEVYRARDLRLGREVAVKVLSSRLARDAESLARFEREARALAALSHPNVAVLYGIEQSGDVSFLVMELVRGESLASRVARRPLSVSETLAIARQIAAGLAAAHEQGIVHRDLKPANVMVSATGEVKLLDFGLSKLPPPASSPDTPTEAVDLLTSAGTVMGTTPYMSPEQLSGQPVDTRADIWSFGCVLFEMLTGVRAFAGDSFAATSVSVFTREPDWSRLPADLPEGAAAMLRRCVRKDLSERLPSMAEAQAVLAGHRPDPAQRLPVRRRVRPGLAIGAVAVAAIAVLLLIPGVRPRVWPGTRQPEIHSIAVLPIASDSREDGQDYFVDGMTEALINDLSALRLWRVISRTSAMHYKTRIVPLPQIARELNVDAVLEGSVMRAGDRVRITARLIHAPTEEGLWSGSYERELKDILRLQREVASAIATELKGRLTQEAASRLQPDVEVNPEVHLLYLQGRFRWNERTPASVEQGIRYFERALERDPTHAASHAGLAESYVLLAAQGIGAWTPHRAFPRAQAAARRALALDESLAGAHAALAYTSLLWDWDWGACEREFERAIELNPSYANAHFWYAAALASRGRFDEAIDRAKQAVVLDPVSPIIAAGLAWVHQLAGDNDAVIAVARPALELNPNFAILHHRIGVAYGHKGLHQLAIDHHRQAVKASGGSPDMLAQLGFSLAAAGHTNEARKTLREIEALAQTRYVSAFSRAIAHLGLGERDAAVTWLEKAAGERSWYLPFAAVDPLMIPLHGDARFERLLTTLRLEKVRPHEAGRR